MTQTVAKIPQGQVTESQCRQISGSYVDVLHHYGVPSDADPSALGYNNLRYPLVGDTKRHCNIYWKAASDAKSGDLSKITLDVRVK